MKDIGSDMTAFYLCYIDNYYYLCSGLLTVWQYF